MTKNSSPYGKIKILTLSDASELNSKQKSTQRCALIIDLLLGLKVCRILRPFFEGIYSAIFTKTI